MDIIVFLTEQWMLVSLLAALGGAFVFIEGKRGGKSLSYHEVTRLVNSGDALIVDVREAKDFKLGHIVDSMNIPHIKIADRASELEKHKSKTIILVDKMGQHAGAAGKVLKEQGFDVTRLKGGMAEWQGQNLPVVKA